MMRTGCWRGCGQKPASRQLQQQAVGNATYFSVRCGGRPTCRGRSLRLGVAAKVRDFVREVVVGIDLGTTNSAVAVIENGKPRCIPNADGDTTTPSVVTVLKDGASSHRSAPVCAWVMHPGMHDDLAACMQGKLAAGTPSPPPPPRLLPPSCPTRRRPNTSASWPEPGGWQANVPARRQLHMGACTRAAPSPSRPPFPPRPAGDVAVGLRAQRQAVLHPGSTYYSVKRLLGRQYSDREVQQEVKRLAYTVRAPFPTLNP